MRPAAACVDFHRRVWLARGGALALRGGERKLGRANVVLEGGCCLVQLLEGLDSVSNRANGSHCGLAPLRLQPLTSVLVYAMAHISMHNPVSCIA